MMTSMKPLKHYCDEQVILDNTDQTPLIERSVQPSKDAERLPCIQDSPEMARTRILNPYKLDPERLAHQIIKSLHDDA